ncbi:unnamed protein product [Lactuca saligna]|uniref:Uncharacterized protein n=1 Tax=Lactuca saligna TaxID=75948 RepID=A0AA35ZMJ6_LACSI|nr:unnamed protein product [Lactuca saligna]
MVFLKSIYHIAPFLISPPPIEAKDASTRRAQPRSQTADTTLPSSKAATPLRLRRFLLASQMEMSQLVAQTVVDAPQNVDVDLNVDEGDDEVADNKGGGHIVSWSSKSNLKWNLRLEEWTEVELPPYGVGGDGMVIEVVAEDTSAAGDGKRWCGSYLFPL